MVFLAVMSSACVASGEGNAPVAVSPVATPTSQAQRPPATAPGGLASPQVTTTAIARTPSPGATNPAGTPATGSPIATPNITGRAITVGDVQQVWASRNINYQPTSGAPAATGFAVPASPLTLSKAGQTVDVVVFVYPNQDAAEQDWTLGSASAPKAGKTLGAFDAIWWNENMVMVLRQRTGDITNEARDAFLGLGGPLPSTPAAAAPTRAPLGSVTPAPASGGTSTPTAAGSATSPTATLAAATATPASVATGTPTPAAPATPPVPR